MAQQIIKKGASGALAIFISRISGLIRDILFARFIGGGAIMSAWVIAFRIPNTFRRFFGEGASSQALIPMLQHIISNEGIENAKNSFGTVFATLGIILSAISISAGIAAVVLAPYFSDIIRINTALCLLPILMPYTIFICLTGICSGILNLFGKFFLPALSSVILNLFIIFALILFHRNSPEILIRQVSWSVLFSGIIQLLAMFYLLKHSGFLPHRFIPGLYRNKAVREFVILVIPGIIGAAAVQINTLVDSFIAIYLGNYAAPALYYSERIIYLPLGIFAVSIGNASLVTMSKFSANKQYDKLNSSLIYGLKQILYITIPTFLFFLIFRSQILTLIYSSSQFGMKEINEVAWAMLFYSIGIPAFAAIKVIISGFYAQKDMKTPVKIALYCVLINFVLNLLLMHPLKQGGIALATTISSFLNCFILIHIFTGKLNISRISFFSPFLISIFKSIISASISLYIAWISFSYIKTITEFIDWRHLIPLTLAGILFCIAYFSLNWILKNQEQKEWFSIFFKQK